MWHYKQARAVVLNYLIVKLLKAKLWNYEPAKLRLELQGRDLFLEFHLPSSTSNYHLLPSIGRVRRLRVRAISNICRPLILNSPLNCEHFLTESCMNHD